MNCCKPHIEPFYNQATTTVNYPVSMQNMYGRYPKVQVVYYDPVAKEYYVSNNFTRTQFSNDNIYIDHGGKNTGWIKIY